MEQKAICYQLIFLYKQQWSFDFKVKLLLYTVAQSSRPKMSSEFRFLLMHMNSSCYQHGVTGKHKTALISVKKI